MDHDNFRFLINNREWVMQNGTLSVDGVEYEDIEDGGAEIYEIARAYWGELSRNNANL